MRYDAIVIGAGQAGSPLTYALADLGWKVALVEREHLGGTCVNVGCTPTKTMVASAQVAHYARNSARWGIDSENVQVDLARVVERKRAVVERFRGGHQRKVEANPNITLHCGAARFTGPSTVSVGDAVLESDKIFLNVGTRPDCPNVPGLDAVPTLDNASVMELTEVPEHLLVLGGATSGWSSGRCFAASAAGLRWSTGGENC